MCGIFGIVSNNPIDFEELRLLARHAEKRGKDSSGLLFSKPIGYDLHNANKAITSLLKSVKVATSDFVMGHSRLITNGLADNQPVYRDGVCVIHNGIVVNHKALWAEIYKTPHQQIDTEVIAAIAAAAFMRHGGNGSVKRCSIAGTSCRCCVCFENRDPIIPMHIKELTRMAGTLHRNR